ncbi:nucleosidase [Gordonia hydrophobica]|uniref:Nucleosidase n=1 Tax=Gordonia hydrophobica TaxID=40516 RepID=A0ABZ2TXC0_9ACTN|nr:nucleosidase [Gordonia hydrophobica]MBM7366336.1 nucleoside phosphorylase [Gordonia hydrophobica]
MSADAVGVLVVSATRAEAAHVPPGTDLLITGIGKVRAASALARRLALGDYHRVVNIGTSGALRDGYRGLFTPSRVVEHDISAAQLAALGFHQPDEWDVPGGDGTVLATGDMFVTEPEHRERLARRAELVDMEGAAIVQVCADFAVPVRLVKVVSDDADDTAFDWPSVIDAAARDLGEWLDGTGFGSR